MSANSPLVPEQERLMREITDPPLPHPALVGYERYSGFEDFAEGGGAILRTGLDGHLQRRVVFKTLRPEHRGNPDVKRRFMREARVTALIQHPATVPVYELGRDPEGLPYFTMKRVRGESLQKILGGIQAKDRAYDRYNSRELLIDVLIQVGQALAYAHACGVVHRDIKPANIQVGGFGEVIVMDWGVAKIMDGGDADEGVAGPDLGEGFTEHGKVYGTPRYMAPEQARGDLSIDHRVDVFSLGAVLYEALVQRPLVFGASREELLRKICDEPFISPSRKEPLRMIPPDLDAVVMKALEKNPEKRYATMAAFVDDLQRFRRGEPVSLMDRSLRARVQRWVQINLPWKRSSVLVLLGAVLGYLAGRG